MHSLSTIPQGILIWAARHLRGSDEEAVFIRRLGVICVNGGVPVNLLDNISSLRINSTHLQTAKLPLANWSEYFQFISNNPVLNFTLENFFLFISADSSESSYRAHLWDSLLINFIRSGNERINFDILAEWKSKSTLQLFNDRRADLSIILKSVKIPILIVEISKDRIPSTSEHKDFTKMLSMMSQLCIRLCHQMRARGQDARKARIFGIWIGSTQFQFCVAHPQFSQKSQEAQMDITAVLTFHDHWRFDIIGGDIPECVRPCCNAAVPNVIYDGAEVYADISFPSTQAEAELDTIFENLDLEPQFNENFDLGEEEEFTNYATTDRTVRTTATNMRFNQISLSKLKSFIDHVMDTCFLIENSPPFNYDDSPPLPPFSSSPTAVIPPSLRSHVSETPEGSRATFSHDSFNSDSDLAMPSTPTRRTGSNNSFTVIKRFAGWEAILYAKMGAQYSIFPHLFDLKKCPNNPENLIFTFERMAPLIDIEGGVVCSPSKIIRSHTPEILLIDGVTLALHILSGLFILHEHLGFVHSDISPTNIMFSHILGIWKINDFDQSMPIEESLRTPRTSGTKNYIPPETLKSRIVNKSTDIYALGQVLNDMIYFGMCNYLELEDLEPKIVRSFRQFSNIIGKMTYTDPERRLSVREAMKHFYDLLMENMVSNVQVYGWEVIISSLVKTQISSFC